MILTDNTDADDADDMTASNTQINPENITNDGDDVKLEVKQVSQEDVRLIEKMFYVMRHYDCQYCPARFNNKAKLATHESRRTKDKKPVVCPHCEKSYSQWDKLRKHIDCIHPGKPHKQCHTEIYKQSITHQPKAGSPLLHVNHIKHLLITDQ